MGEVLGKNKLPGRLGVEILHQIYMEEWLGDENEETRSGGLSLFSQEAQNSRKGCVTSDTDFKMRGERWGQRRAASAESLAGMGGDDREHELKTPHPHPHAPRSAHNLLIQFYFPRSFSIRLYTHPFLSPPYTMIVLPWRGGLCHVMSWAL